MAAVDWHAGSTVLRPDPLLWRSFVAHHAAPMRLAVREGNVAEILRLAGQRDAAGRAVYDLAATDEAGRSQRAGPRPR
jgi:hypothetical protein